MIAWIISEPPFLKCAYSKYIEGSRVGRLTFLLLLLLPEMMMTKSKVANGSCAIDDELAKCMLNERLLKEQESSVVVVPISSIINVK